MKSLVVEARMVESNNLLPQLLDNFLTHPEESAESSDIISLSSFPFRNKDKENRNSNYNGRRDTVSKERIGEENNDTRKLTKKPGIIYWEEENRNSNSNGRRDIVRKERVGAGKKDTQKLTKKPQLLDTSFLKFYIFNTSSLQEGRTLETGTFTSIFKSLALKHLEIKRWDEYGFVIRPCLVGVTYESMRINL
nr:protein ILITYHIA isoform X1 [Tanacetum cinerariifolium]